MYIYDVDKIENLYDDFISFCKKFNSNEIDDFRKGYIYKSSEYPITKIKTNIDSIYNKMSDSVNKIKSVWNDYINDVRAIDNFTGGHGSAGAIHDSATQGVASSLPELTTYNSAFSAVLNSDIGRNMAANTGATISTIINDFSLKDLLKYTVDLYVKARCTVVNIAVSFVKGLVSFVEAVGDALIIAAGAVATIFTAASDVGNLFGSWITGEEWGGWKNTKALWEDTVFPVVGYNWTDKVFDTIWYDRAWGKFVEEKSYCKSDGVLCSISEGVGYYTGFVLLSTATGGTSAVAQGAIMGTAALGKNVQKGYNKLSDEEKHDSKALGKMMAISTGKAVVEGAVFGGAQAAGKAASAKVVEKIAANNMSGVINIGSSHAINAANLAKTSASIGVKSIKPIANESIDAIIGGDKFSAKDVLVDEAALVLSEAAAGAPKIIGSTSNVDSAVTKALEKAAKPDISGATDLNSDKAIFSTLKKDVLGAVKDKIPTKAEKEIIKSVVKETDKALVSKAA